MTLIRNVYELERLEEHISQMLDEADWTVDLCILFYKDFRTTNSHLDLNVSERIDILNLIKTIAAKDSSVYVVNSANMTIEATTKCPCSACLILYTKKQSIIFRHRYSKAAYAPKSDEINSTADFIEN